MFPSLALRSSTLARVFTAVLWGGVWILHGGARVAAQCGSEEPPLRNYVGAGAAACPCFISGEEAGVVLTAPAGHYPIELTRLRIGWGSVFGGTPQSLEQAIHVYPAGLPNPGAPQFSLVGPVLTDGAINEFNISFVPGNKVIASGPFTISLEFLNQNANNVFAPSVVHDNAGCAGGKNVVKAIPGGWNDACLLGVSGNWVMEVVYRRVNCPTPPRFQEASRPIQDATERFLLGADGLARPLHARVPVSVGEAWSVEVDCRGRAPGVVLLVGSERARAGPRFVSGDVVGWARGRRLFALRAPHAGNVVTFRPVLPAAAWTLGREVLVQGVVLGAEGPRLTDGLVLELAR